MNKLGPRSPLPPLNTPILIYSPGAKRWREGEVSRNPDHDIEPGDDWPYSVYIRGYVTTCDFSHWMPMPPPPGAQEKSE